MSSSATDPFPSPEPPFPESLFSESTSEALYPWYLDARSASHTHLDRQFQTSETAEAAASQSPQKNGTVVSVQILHEDGRYRDVLNRAEQMLAAEDPPRPEQMAEILELAAYAAAELGLRNESTHLHELATHRPGRLGHARINLIHSLAQLQLRHHAFDTARRTVGKGIRLLRGASGEARSVPTHVHAAMYEIAARVRLRLLAGAPTPPSEEGSTARRPLLRAAHDYQRRAQAVLEDVAPTRRGSIERDLLHNAIDFARLRGDVEEASRLARQARQTASSEGSAYRLIRSIHHQSLVARDQTEYQRALGLLDEAERIQQRTGEASFRPLLLSDRVHVAVELGDRRAAHRAMTTLINLAENVPEPVVRRASVAYANVFDPASDPPEPSLWHLLALAAAVTVVIQTVGAAAHRHYRAPSFRGRELSASASAGDDRATVPGASAIEASAAGATTNSAESGRTGRVFLDPQETTRPPFPLKPPADLDLSWLSGVGITVRPGADSDLRPLSSGSGAARGQKTLEDVFRQVLAERSSIACYRPDGKKAFDLPLSAMVRDHVVKDRFAALDLSGQTLITYRYTRPQRMVVVRERDGRLQTTELPSPISAVPIARIESVSDPSEKR